MELNEWGDPVNTIYVVMWGSCLHSVFKCWKAANEFADSKNIAALKRGEPDEFWVHDEWLR